MRSDCARQPDPIRAIVRVASWFLTGTVLVLACSTRVDIAPKATASDHNPDIVDAVGETTKDASVLDPAIDGGNATGSNADAALSTNGTSSPDTPSVTNPAPSINSGASGPTELPNDNSSPPIPTRQLTVPLPNAKVKFVILVSIDGLAARFLEQLIAEGRGPTFAHLQSIAAWTHNARTDKTHTYTLPNHTCMLTSLPVQPVPGLESYRAHFYVNNTDPVPGATLHQLRYPDRSYTFSMFDVAHDAGLTTAMFASKTKFSLYSQTYNDAGGPDTVGKDNGNRKIDTVVINTDTAALVSELTTKLKTLPPHLTFVHLNQPDGTGHSLGWGSPEYLDAVSNMDALLGQILVTIQTGQLRDRTALIVTTDHGGVDYSHLNAEDRNNFQIPFYLLAPGVAPGDAYAVLEHRTAPGEDNPGYEAPNQPLRNGDAGNLALDLLGLGPIPESVIHSAGLQFTH